jgi:hypothetical protein
MSIRALMPAWSIRIAVLLLFGLITTQAFAGRVPTKYNDRYQSLYAEQELFRKRPELLGCVALAKDFAQTTSGSVFNKLRFTPKSVQTAYVLEGTLQGMPYQKVRIYAEGRVRAYSFFENWEPAVVLCDVPLEGPPRIVLEMGKNQP